MPFSTQNPKLAEVAAFGVSGLAMFIFIIFGVTAAIRSMIMYTRLVLLKRIARIADKQNNKGSKYGVSIGYRANKMMLPKHPPINPNTSILLALFNGRLVNISGNIKIIIVNNGNPNK